MQALWARLAGLIVAALALYSSSTSAEASVTCMVRQNGRYTCTFYCRDGFICDVPNLRCLPGPRLKAELAKLQEQARKSKLAYQRIQEKEAKNTNAKLTGFGSGNTYYLWNGDPRVIPTPRYSNHGQFSAVRGSAGPASTVRASLQARTTAMRSTIVLPNLPSPGTFAAASRSSSSGTPSSGKLPWYWDGVDYSNYCATANSVERGSAYYGYLCSPDAPNDDTAKKSDHRPYPDPKDLDRHVSQICGPYSRDSRQCFFENKQRIILENNPDIRDACEQYKSGAGGLRESLRQKLGSAEPEGDPNSNPYTRCVDDAYLNGLTQKTSTSLRDSLRERLAKRGPDAAPSMPQATDEPKRPPPDRLPDDGCGPGRGLQPDPSAFGAWTCQPLNRGIPGYDLGRRNNGESEASPAASPENAAGDPTLEELESYLNMPNVNSGGNLRGQLGAGFAWGSEDYIAIQKLLQ